MEIEQEKKERKYIEPTSHTRNYPCPCGSGSKLKKCCGSFDMKRKQDEEFKQKHLERLRELEEEKRN